MPDYLRWSTIFVLPYFDTSRSSIGGRDGFGTTPAAALTVTCIDRCCKQRSMVDDDGTVDQQSCHEEHIRCFLLAIIMHGWNGMGWDACLLSITEKISAYLLASCTTSSL